MMWQNNARRKYRNEQKIISMYSIELEKFRPIKNCQTRASEKLANLPNITAVDLKEIYEASDQESAWLYLKFQQKLPKSTLVSY